MKLSDVFHIFFCVKVVLALFSPENLDIISSCLLLLAVTRPGVHATGHGGIWEKSTHFLREERCSRYSKMEIWTSLQRALDHGVLAVGYGSRILPRTANRFCCRLWSAARVYGHRCKSILFPTGQASVFPATCGMSGAAAEACRVTSDSSA